MHPKFLLWATQANKNYFTTTIFDGYLYPILASVILAVFIFPWFNLYNSWRGKHWFYHLKAVFLALLSILLILALFFIISFHKRK